MACKLFPSKLLEATSREGAHACSALISIGTVSAAGVETVITCSPPRGERIALAVIYAVDQYL